MELIGKTRLPRSAAEAAAFWEQAFHDNAAWKALVRWDRRPQLTPQISYHVYDRQIPEPDFFEISFLPISSTQCIMLITGLNDGAALAKDSVGYLAYMRCEVFCGEFHSLIAAMVSMADAVVAPVTPSSEPEARLIRRGKKVTTSRLIREEQNMKIEAMVETHSVEIIADKVGLNVDTVKTRIKKLKNSP